MSPGGAPHQHEVSLVDLEVWSEAVVVVLTPQRLDLALEAALLPAVSPQLQQVSPPRPVAPLLVRGLGCSCLHSHEHTSGLVTLGASPRVPQLQVQPVLDTLHCSVEGCHLLTPHGAVCGVLVCWCVVSVGTGDEMIDISAADQRSPSPSPVTTWRPSAVSGPRSGGVCHMLLLLLPCTSTLCISTPHLLLPPPVSGAG